MAIVTVIILLYCVFLLQITVLKYMEGFWDLTYMYQQLVRGLHHSNVEIDG